MGFQIALLSEHHKDRFARINERPILDLIEHPPGQVGRQIGRKAQSADASLFPDGFGLRERRPRASPPWGPCPLQRHRRRFRAQSGASALSVSGSSEQAGM